MAYNWMKDVPVGSLKRDKEPIGGFESNPSTLRGDTMRLMEDHKSGYIDRKTLTEEIQALKDKAFEDVDIPTECGYCSDLVAVDDIYNTGDSPTDYDCTGSAMTCPALLKRIGTSNANTTSD